MTTKFLTRGLIIPAIIFLAVFSYLLPIKLISSAQLDKASFAPTQSYFSSTSTSNGIRRFNATGNFLDTTNNAYFQNSIAYLDFTIPRNRNMLVREASIRIYKYASSSDNLGTEFEIIHNNMAIFTAHADSSDLDYDEIVIPLGSLISGPVTETRSLDFKLQGIFLVENNGFAFCSGNITDSICPEQYHPRLVLHYEPNTKGVLKEYKFFGNKVYNSEHKSESTLCKANSGCEFKAVIDYLDKEKNANFYLIISDANQIEKLLKLTQVQENLFTFKIPDGQYLARLYIEDGEFAEYQDLDQFTIDTIPPEKPSIEYLSDFSSKAGFDVKLEPAKESKLEVFIGNCGSNGTCSSEGSHTKSVDKFTLNYKHQQPLTDQIEYYYQIYYKDAAGNNSPKAIFKLKQNNILAFFTHINVHQTTISPKNNDKKFDDLTVNWGTSEPGIISKVILSSKKNGTREFKELSALQNYLKLKSTLDGQYNVELIVIDNNGYQVQRHPPISFISKNSPPNIYKGSS